MTCTMKVAAVVVTYNREELLQNTLDCLDAQTYAPACVEIIDNASTDATQESLRARKHKLPTKVYRLAENSGGAGGFFYGMNAAYADGYDAFWLMDDDTAPRPDALEKLVDTMEDAAAHRGEMPSFASSQVLWTDGNACLMNYPTARWEWPQNIAAGTSWIDLDCASFVSCLVTREAVEQCGLPYPEYFIWFDDAEYTYRLAKWRSGIYVPASIADHLTPENKGVFWGEVSDSNFWKYSKGARNQVSAGISLRKPRILTDIAFGLFQGLRHSDAPWKLRLKLAGAAASGIFHQPKVRYPGEVKVGSPQR
ncbi:MAG: glycosyltransferase family 2 protein [Actinomycetaceae bacterium]|nr:glycosyltransferase family 2 protein [Arcanobacterium sp.]MDD7505177.1 glycosyltransferase family 2 protein [Actinomycetaceae bacterium]